MLGVNARWDLTRQLFLTAHSGIARYRNETHDHSTWSIDGGQVASPSSRYRVYDTNYYAGLGLGYDISSRISITLTYDHYAPRYASFGFKSTYISNTYSGGVELRF
jgi:hypothetical protein